MPSARLQGRVNWARTLTRYWDTAYHYLPHRCEERPGALGVALLNKQESSARTTIRSAQSPPCLLRIVSGQPSRFFRAAIANLLDLMDQRLAAAA